MVTVSIEFNTEIKLVGNLRCEILEYLQIIRFCIDERMISDQFVLSFCFNNSYNQHSRSFLSSKYEI